MPDIKRNAIMPFSAAQMFQLVDNVGAYSEFLPWCSESVIQSRTEDEVVATLSLHVSAIREKFTTRNRYQLNKMIEIKLVDGPFKRMDGYWRFEPLADDACKVQLDLRFEFASTMLSMILTPIFNHITNTVMDAFLKRAHEVYGAK